jgi:ApaG protein
MYTSTQHGIKIKVEVIYQSDYSKPVKNEFVFAYRISIENQNASPFQLLRRHWYIWDSNLIRREVEGEGVVGQLPIIESGEMYTYISGCPLLTEMGKMKGYYVFRNQDTLEEIEVPIPEFQFIAPQKNN